MAGRGPIHTTESECRVAVIGAGPYGLATGAHLRAAGVDTRVFGEPMAFWRRQMPRGMLLRSPWGASSIADPGGRLSLDRYKAELDPDLRAPVPLDRFVQYGEWYQRQALPDVDTRLVRTVSPADGGFVLELEDGDRVLARRVVVAAGLEPFGNRPHPFDALPSELASHSADHADLRRFGGRRVAVIGGGQSALESAALLHEGGAEVELFVRAPLVRWLGRSAWLHRFRPVARLLYAPTDVGPAGLSWLVAAPNWFRRFPRATQDKWAARSIRPAGAAWVRPRVEGVPIAVGRAVVAAAPADGGVRLQLDDGTERDVDHVLMATGYRVDVARYPFLDAGIVRSLARVDGYPRLSPAFESSVPGLHFVGAPAAWSFGPLMRFVSGAGFTARAVSRAIARERTALPRAAAPREAPAEVSATRAAP